MADRKRDADADQGRRKSKPCAITSNHGPARVTRSQKATASMKAVFGTAELLERIFLHLPARKALAAQRVCQQFRDIVAKSKVLQEAIFLKPSSTSPSQPELWTLVYRRTQFMPYYEGPILVHTSEADAPNLFPGPYDDNSSWTPARLNDMLTLQPKVRNYTHLQDSNSAVFHSHRPTLILEPAASWRAMSITTPAPKTASVDFSWEIRNVRPKLHGSATGVVRTGEGATLGALVDAALDDVLYREGRKEYYQNNRFRVHHGSLRELLESKEAETGKRAVFDGDVVIGIRGVFRQESQELFIPIDAQI